jgi:hypothetical protein
VAEALGDGEAADEALAVGVAEAGTGAWVDVVTEEPVPLCPSQ